ncbi:MAG: YIP1 family protein [Candidatus Methanoperedens sp.]|nr:YIP1 family protein [Candidatus Methanoperedens sp.]
MNFTEKIIETIKNPKNAMKSISEQPMIEEAVTIVGISAVLGALAAYIQSYKVTYVFEGFPEMPASTMMAIFGILVALIGSFIGWFIIAGIVHLVSMALGGEGKFHPQMMTIAGYSFIPMIFANLISIAMLLIIDPITITISPTDPTAMREFYESSYFINLNIIAIIMQIWASIILFFGIQEAHRLSAAKSAIVAGIPLVFVVISLLWTFRSMGIL